MAEIRITGPDGSTFSFPAGTPGDVISSAMQGHYGSAAQPKLDSAQMQGLARGRANAEAGIRPELPAGTPTPDQDMARIRRTQSGATGTVGDVAGQFIGGLPFVGEYADEAIGAINGPEARDRMRADQSTFEQDNPGTSMALRTAGGIAGTVPMAAAAAPLAAGMVPASLGGQVLAGGATGMIGGGVEGAVSGYGSGTDSESRVENAQSRGKLGAVMGAGAGIAMPAIAAGAKPVINKIADALTSSRRAAEVGLSKPSASILSRGLDADGSFGGSGAANIARAGPDGMLADAGPNARTLLDTAIQRSGPAGVQAQRAIEQRASGAGVAIRDTMDATLGAPQGIGASARGIAANARPALREAYDRAYNLPIDYASDAGRNIEATLKRVPSRIMKQAVDTANEAMQVAGTTNKQILADIADDGTVVFREMPNVQQLDEIKKALGEIGANEVDQFGRPTAAGARAKMLARDVKNATSDAVPEYAAAVKLGGDKIAEDQALDLGRKILRPNTTREQVLDAVADASEAERAALAQGLRYDIEEKMANVSRAVTDGNMDAREAVKAIKDFSSRASREKIEAAIGAEKAKTLFADLDRATMALDLRAGVQQNSKTFARLSMDDTITAQQDGGAVGALLEGKPIGATQRIAQALSGRTPEAKTAMADKTYQEIVQALTTRRGADAQRVLSDLQYIGGRSARNEEIARALSRGGSLALGLPAYQTGTQAMRPRQ